MHDRETPGRIHLLIVDDVPDTVHNIRKLLHFEQDIQVVAAANSAREAIEKAIRLQPDVILMDINMPDMDGLRATEAIVRQVPTRVVMMSIQNEPEYFNRAMMVGARGFLVKPFTSEELITTVRAAAQLPVLHPFAAASPPPAARAAAPAAPDRQRLHCLIAVYSPKGGVGRSVIACNLAVALKRHTDASVALIDADLQSGDAHVLLNMNMQTSFDDLREAGGLDADIIGGTLVRHDSGIEVLRAPLALESAELYNGERMKAILIELREHFDFLVVDTDDTFSETTLTVLDMADQILLITTLEVTTINKVTRFFEVVERLGYPESKVQLVCNRVDPYFGIRPAQVEAQMRHRFIAQIPEDNRAVVTSVNRGVPFTIADRRTAVSRSIAALAQRVAEQARQPEPPVQRSGAAGWLGHGR